MTHRSRAAHPRLAPMRALLGACGLLLLLPGCSGKSAGADSAGTPATADSGGNSSMSLPVVGETVRREDLVLTIATTGQVHSEAVADLKAETSGTIDSVLVRPGDVVRHGDVLARLDPRPFDLAVREAEASLAEANIRLRGNLASDSILLTNHEDQERQQNAMTLSGVPAAQVRLERAQLDRERTAITAPFAGVVDRVDVAEGSRVAAGQAVATVVDVSHLRVEAQVLEHDLPFVRVGGLALISTPATSGAPIRGRISAILPLVDSTTRAGRVVVMIGGGEDAVGAHGSARNNLGYARSRLFPGAYADLRLEATRLPNRILVPARAVIERDGRPLVFVVKGGRAQWVYILPGRTNGQDTEVLPDSSTGQIPVTVGDTVLVEGHLTLTHDAPVRVTAAAEQR